MGASQFGKRDEQCDITEMDKGPLPLDSHNISKRISSRVSNVR